MGSDYSVHIGYVQSQNNPTLTSGGARKFVGRYNSTPQLPDTLTSFVGSLSDKDRGILKSTLQSKRCSEVAMGKPSLFIPFEDTDPVKLIQEGDQEDDELLHKGKKHNKINVNNLHLMTQMGMGLLGML